MKLRNFLLYLTFFGLFFLNSCMEISEQTSSLVLTLPSNARSAISSEEIEKYLISLSGEKTKYSEEKTALPGEAVEFAELEADVYAVRLSGFVGDDKVAYGEAQATVKDGETSEIQITMKMILEKFTVSFESNGGSSVDSQTVIEGNTASEPDAPTKEADENATYAFAGWYTDESLENAFDFETAVTANLELYAK
nr:InlB B-repeat-containing protein [Treponemataceae bacterium]